MFVEDSAASAALAAKYPITVAVTGLGIVQVSPGQPAGGYAKDTIVRLTAAPRDGWSLESWGGACAGTNEFCMLTIDAAKNVTAKFKATGLPAVVSAAWAQPQADGTSLVSWEASSGATQYTVELNGKSVCKTTQTNCSLGRIVGPKDFLLVRAINAAGTADASAPAVVVAPLKALQLFTVNFGSGSSTLTAKAKTTLSAAVKRIKSLGYSEMTIIGHTDNRETNASALSVARAKSVETLMKSVLNVTYVTQGKGATSPLTSNSTIQGRSLNRRAVGWIK